jgi:hypothetical protein
VFPAPAPAPVSWARRRPGGGGGDRGVFSPTVWLALVTCLVYVNQVLFTVYVLRVHGGDPSFIARYLPAGWFDLASAHPVLRGLAEHFPAPGLLAPSVLRVQAFLELPFVMLAFATAVRWLIMPARRPCRVPSGTRVRRGTSRPSCGRRRRRGSRPYAG